MADCCASMVILWSDLNVRKDDTCRSTALGLDDFGPLRSSVIPTSFAHPLIPFRNCFKANFWRTLLHRR